MLSHTNSISIVAGRRLLQISLSLLFTILGLSYTQTAYAQNPVLTITPQQPITAPIGLDTTSLNADGIYYIANDVDTIVVDVALDIAGNSLSSTSFQLQYNSCLGLDFNDITVASYPIAIPTVITGQVQIDIVTFSLTPPLPTLSSGTLATFPFDVSNCRNNSSIDATQGITLAYQAASVGGTLGVDSITVDHADTAMSLRFNAMPADISLTNYTVDEGGSFSTILSVTDIDAAIGDDNHTYALTSCANGADNSNFQVSGNTLSSDSGTVFDHEAKGTYHICVAATDWDGLTYTEEVTVTVNNLPETPTGITLSNDMVVENNAAISAVGTFTTTDPDDPTMTDMYTYTLMPGSSADFTLAGDQLETVNTFDFENILPDHTIIVSTTDSSGLSYVESFTVTVTDGNDPPTAITLSNTTIAENSVISTAVGMLDTTDQDANDTHTYALIGGATSDFALVNDTLVSASVFDYNTQGSYTVTIETSDGTATYSDIFTIIVDNGNDVPTDIILSGSQAISENLPISTTIGNLTTLDLDVGDTHTYSLVGGATSEFVIVGDVLKSNVIFDFETKASYTVTVRATDDGLGTLTYDKVLTITIVDNSEPPFDIFWATLPSVALPVPENAAVDTLIGLFKSDDADSTQFNYSLVGGAVNLFRIFSDTLLVSDTLDFETNPFYTVTVRSTDEMMLTYDEVFTITVSNANDAPTAIVLTSYTITENLPISTVVAALTTTDQDSSDSHSYTLIDGAMGLFDVVGSDLKSTAVFDYENGSTSYTLTIETMDDGTPSASYSTTVMINVQDANDAPSGLMLSSNTITEDMPISTTIGMLSTTDQDSGDANNHTYSLVDGATTAFHIVGNMLNSNMMFDFESQSSYTVTVRTTDPGNGYYDETFTITIINSPDDPYDISLDTMTIDENAGANTLVGTISSQDGDMPFTHTYSFIGPAGPFIITNDTLNTNGSAIDFEANSNYTITIQATDDTGLIDSEMFTITVLNVNEPPTSLMLDTSSITENVSIGTMVGQLSSTDTDAAYTHTYSLVGGATSVFSITGNMLQTNAAINFENTQSYTVEVQVTDEGGLGITEIFTITVIDEDDSPTDIMLSGSQSITENLAAGATIGQLTTTDPDNSAGTSIYTYTILTDVENAFTLNGDMLESAISFDFESLSSYTLTVQTTDMDGLTYSEVLTITIIDSTDAATGINLSGTGVITENNTVGETIGQLTAVPSGIYTYSIVGGATGQFTINGSSLQANSIFDAEGQRTYTITVQAENSIGGLYTEVLTITVGNSDEVPVVMDDVAGTLAGQAIAISVLDNDTDPEGNALSIVDVGTSSGNGMVSFSSSVITYTPGTSMTDVFTYTVNDGMLSAQATVTVTTVPIPALSLPNAIGELAALNGMTVSVPLLLNSGGGAFQSVSIDVDYDSSCLGYVSLAAASGLTTNNKSINSNNISFDVDAGAGQLPDSTEIVDLVFNVNLTGNCANQSGTNLLVNTTVPITVGTAPAFTLTPAAQAASGINSVNGTMQNGMLTVVENDPRGDCNSDGKIDAGDLAAVVIESFDAGSRNPNDGPEGGPDFWLYAYRDNFVGSPIGCDVQPEASLSINANPLSFVEIPDLICLVSVLFGDDSCTMPAAVTSANALSLDTSASDAPTQEGQIEVAIMLKDGQNRASTADFTVNFDNERFDFVDLHFHNLPTGMNPRVVENEGSVQAVLFIATFPMPALSDGRLATLVLQPKDGEEVAISDSDVELTNVSIGTVDGSSTTESTIVAEVPEQTEEFTSVEGTVNDYSVYMPLILR